MITVFVKEQEVYAPVGWFEAERKLKVRLLITVKVKLRVEPVHDALAETLDYSILADIVRKESSSECKLLETLAEKIKEAILQLVPDRAMYVYVCIDKPLLPAERYFAKSAGIEYEWHARP